MFFILSKILSFLLSPIWWITVLLLAFLILKKYAKRKRFLIASLVILLLFSNPLLFYHVSGWWEGELQNPATLEQHDGIILLGGLSNYRSKPQRIHFNSSADRLLQAVELYKKGKANTFVFTGGAGSLIVREKKEGEYIKDYLELLDIPKESIQVEWNSRNTHENAFETLKLLQAKDRQNGRYILVTSGFHMKRALGCFQKQGIHVTPYATAPLQGNLPPEIWDSFTPSASALATWEQLFREWVGYFVYKMKGYV